MEKHTEKEAINQQIGRAEQEGRMVLPGIQALFGFQLIAVFSAGFFEKLSAGMMRVHFISLLCSALSALFILTPPAFHR